MKMKKLFAALLALCMMLSLAACAKEEPQAPGDEPAPAPAPGGAVATYLDATLDNDELQYWFWDSYYNFLEYYGYNYYFDPSLPLKDQKINDTNTWEDYFFSVALNDWVTCQMLTLEARKNGYEMPAELAQEVRDLEKNVTDYANNTLGEANMDKYFADYYGEGANMTSFKSYTEKLYYSTAYGDLKYAEVAEKLAKETTDLPRMVDVRHILVTPTDATLDADWASAKARAERFYEDWKADPTEDNFARMVGLYSEDPGSVDNGGLYEDVYPGQMLTSFNDWCFDASRQVGDTGIVETPYGYHLMYFVGFGEVYAGGIADQAAEQYYDWLDTLMVADALSITRENAEIRPIAVQKSGENN